jgi:hypothetical protein
MTNEFVPMDLALKLKALGFKERVLTYYEDGKPKLHTTIEGWDFNSSFLNCVSRPIYSQAFDWFRQNYPYRFYVLPCSQHEKYLFEITLPSSIFYTSSEDEAYNTYKEARQHCLEKLIEIIK